MPGLWEAEGHLGLDGVAWYRRRFDLGDTDGYWTLRFGAVMDFADVFLNGIHVGSHESAFTPFELDVTAAVVRGENELVVRVVDPPERSFEHLRTAHGKQGWANDWYPSPPSLYLTYGGIWQPVTLERHGPLVVRDVFVNGDPDDLVVTLDVCARAASAGRTRVATLGIAREEVVELAAGGRRTLQFAFGRVDAPGWSPDSPVLHELAVNGETLRYGLRTVRIEGRRILLNGEPYRMKSALVQGFYARELYGEPAREAIRDEVLAAKAMGFNTLRLHIKAFDPAYLDVCDEVGMLLHCDLPVAEPIAYEDLGADTLLARRSVAAAREQVRRDRNHPSVVLWTAMNEIGLERQHVRAMPEYEAFVRTVVAAVQAEDTTRPVIENDWLELDPSHVFVSPILTAHWYGRLHADFLDALDRRSLRHADLERPQLVSEFGDWGLPQMPELAEPPFWDTRALYGPLLARTPWPHSFERFVEETQRYQGVCDRLQAEVFRRHDHLGGYCVTELTDVPHEYNGLLELERNPKPTAVDELTRANQVVLPMLDLRSLAVEAGRPLHATLHVANDGAALRDVEIDVGGERVDVGELAAYRATRVGEVTVPLPETPGPHELVLELRSAGRIVAENRYPLRLVAVAPPPENVHIVPEDALDEGSGVEVRERLRRGETVVVLAQPPEAERWYPVPIALKGIDSRFGGSIFSFTSADSPLTAFPQGQLLVGEDMTLVARAVVVEVDGAEFPERPFVVRYNPRGTTGTFVGAHPVGGGTLVFCQYGLGRGDIVARSLLADLASTEPAAPCR